MSKVYSAGKILDGITATTTSSELAFNVEDPVLVHTLMVEWTDTSGTMTSLIIEILGALGSGLFQIMATHTLTAAELLDLKKAITVAPIRVDKIKVKATIVHSGTLAGLDGRYSGTAYA